RGVGVVGGGRCPRRREPARRPAPAAARPAPRAAAASGLVSRAPRVDLRPHLEAVAAVATLPGQPQALCAGLDAALGAVLGHRLFTLMRYHEATRHSARIYPTHPREYPVG